MRGTVAKRIRRQVYGKGQHPGPVLYSCHFKNKGVIVSDEKRWSYQQTKKEYILNKGVRK